MTSTTIQKPRRSVLPLFNLVLGGAALTVGVVALATDNGSTADNLTNRPETQEATSADLAVWELLPPGPVRDAMREPWPSIRHASTRIDYCVTHPVRGGPFAC
jgi:hypothetical protein